MKIKKTVNKVEKTGSAISSVWIMWIVEQFVVFQLNLYFNNISKPFKI